jgi:hypothetical protein
MQKIKDFILSVNVTVFIFFLIGVRITAVGASIGDALAIVSLCALQGFNAWLKQQEKPDINIELKKEVSDIKAYISGLSIKAGLKSPSPSQENRRFF